MRSIRAALLNLGKRHPGLRVFFRSVQAWSGRLFFWLGSLRRVDPNLVVFEAFLGRTYAGSPRSIYERMLADPRLAHLRFVWFFRDTSHADAFPELATPRTRIVRYRSATYRAAYARAGTWISNSIIPTELVPRRGQRYLQTWHGTPLKRIGLDVVDVTANALSGKGEINSRYRVEGNKVTWFLSSSAFTDEAFASAFALPTSGPRQPIARTGNPRNDALVTASDDDIRALRARHSIPDGTRVLLYAPTWREDQHDSRTGYTYRSPIDFSRLREQLGGDVVVLFRAHYLVSNGFDFAAHGGFVRDVSKVDDINELFLISDALITDYSSAFFDYALLDRPILFYMYDLEHYERELRGFYLAPSTLPGPIVSTQDALAERLNAIEGVAENYRRSRQELVRRMNPLDDGRASARAVALAFPDATR